jgi:exopolyphosphatase/guanosine-5'-triphosphate,3'-diphosphate pyrophosphatase
MLKEKEFTRGGVIDIGTNSVKLVLAERARTDIAILESLKNIVPLGKDLFLHGRIAHDTINRTVTILNDYARKLDEYAIPAIKVIATTAAREASNRDIFIDTILRRTGFTVEVLTVGDVVYYIDAYLSHKLTGTYPIHEKNVLVAELGGGSLDISVMSKGYILMHTGLPLGTLRLKHLLNKLDGSLQERHEALGEYIRNEFLSLRKNLPLVAIDDVLLIDESHTPYLGRLLPARRDAGAFFSLAREDTEALRACVIDKTSEDIADDYQVPPEVAGILPGYVMIIEMFGEISDNKTVHLFDVSLSEAVMAGMLLDYSVMPRYDKSQQLRQMARAICAKYRVDLKHVEHVAMIAEQLFASVSEVMGLKSNDGLYLMLAAYLHDIGGFIHNRSHHKHAEYVIANLNLSRLAEDEIKVIACIARYHRKGNPSDTHLLYRSLSRDRQMLVQKMSAILRIANALDSSHRGKVKRVEVKTGTAADMTLIAHVEGNFQLEKLYFSEKKEMFESISGHRISFKLHTE